MQLHCERARAVEDELASVQGQLTETRRELHRLKAILTSSAHAIHTALQVHCIHSYTDPGHVYTLLIVGSCCRTCPLRYLMHNHSVGIHVHNTALP